MSRITITLTREELASIVDRNSTVHNALCKHAQDTAAILYDRHAYDSGWQKIQTAWEVEVTKR